MNQGDIIKSIHLIAIFSEFLILYLYLKDAKLDFSLHILRTCVGHAHLACIIPTSVFVLLRRAPNHLLLNVYALSWVVLCIFSLQSSSQLI